MPHIQMFSQRRQSLHGLTGGGLLSTCCSGAGVPCHRAARKPLSPTGSLKAGPAGRLIGEFVIERL